MTYHPQHALIRAVRRAPWPAKVAALAVPPAVAFTVVLTSASAGTSPAVFSTEQAGYAVTHAHFQEVNGTVFLRNPAGFISAFATDAGPGLSVQLWGNDVLSAGVSTYNGAPSTAPYDAAFVVFNASTHAEIGSCLAGNPAGTGGVTCNTSVTGEPGAFPAGASITEKITYNRVTGVVSFSIGAGTNVLSGTFTDTGDSFGQARVGGELASTPWAVPSGYTPPASDTELARIGPVTLVSNTGHRAGLTNSYWTASPVIATGPGSVVIAKPGPVQGGNTFKVLLGP